MPVIKARKLDAFGIITDIDPYDLPPTAFSFGYNIRFRNGRLERAPVYRSARQLSTASPRFAYAVRPTSGLDALYVGYKSGKVYLVTPSSETDYTIAAYSTSSVEATWTGTTLANVTYVNRSDRTPWYLLNGASQFVDLGGGAWSANDTCALLKTCGGALVALHVTKTGVNYPTMVKTSSFPTANAIPTSWDYTDATTLATENILAEMEGRIVDACNFGSDLIIYGHKEAWLMQKTNSFDVFDYRKLPFQKGAINANCSVEIGSKHFIFGPDDIWVHDGVSEKSLVEQRIKRFVFDSIDSSKYDECFVYHNPRLKDIHFCYVSSDRGVNFPAVDGCNRAAVYNYERDTWTFDDMPYIWAGTYANVADSSLTYTTVTGTYATAGGSYLDYEDGYKRTPVFVGDANTAASLSDSLYAFDLYGEGSTSTFDVDTDATKGAYFERDGIDFDAIDPAIKLQDYKLLSYVVPQGRIDSGANTTLSLEFGTADYFGNDATFDGTAMTFDGDTLYKLDFNQGGRFLSLKGTYDDYTTFSLSGFDLMIENNGER